MENGELSKSELQSLAERESRKFLKAIEISDIAMGNEALKSLKQILDAAINNIDFNDLWYVDKIEFSLKTFCFTGKFKYGSKELCENETVARGGLIAKNLTLAVDYLVVGGEKHPDWAHQNYGRKIERALEIRKQGKGDLPHIVSEEDWVKSL